MNGINHSTQSPASLDTLPVDVLKLVLKKLPLYDILKIPQLNRTLQKNMNNIVMWKFIAEREGVEYDPNSVIGDLISRVRDKVKSIYFGKYFKLNGTTLHVPENSYMIPNGIGPSALRALPSESAIVQVNGVGVFKYIYKNAAGDIKFGSYYKEDEAPSGLGKAVQISFVRDIKPPSKEVIEGWKSVKVKGLEVNDWGIPFAVTSELKFKAVKCLSKKIVKAFPEPCFVWIKDFQKNERFCVNKNDKGKTSVLASSIKNMQELSVIRRNRVEIFLIIGNVADKLLIRPNPKLRDLE